jgi:hypothetical protein
MGQAALKQGGTPAAGAPEKVNLDKNAPGTAGAAHMVKAREQSRDVSQPD